MSTMPTINKPLLLFIGDAKDDLAAKFGAVIAKWIREECYGQLRFPDCPIDLGLPDLSIKEAKAKGVKSMIIGVAKPGGKFDDKWKPYIKDALTKGIDVVFASHSDVQVNSEFLSYYNKSKLINLRAPINTEKIPYANAKKRGGRRILTVGTDIGIGKLTTTLFIDRVMKKLNIPHSLVATGQTGMVIAGSGICIDAVSADYFCGVIEHLSPDIENDDFWYLIEGQGSLLNPTTSVVAALVQGSQPDIMVLCHNAARDYYYGISHKNPPLLEHIKEYEKYARVTNPAAKIVAISINTSEIPREERHQYISEQEKLTGLPCMDNYLDDGERLKQIIKKYCKKQTSLQDVKSTHFALKSEKRLHHTQSESDTRHLVS